MLTLHQTVRNQQFVQRSHKHDQHTSGAENQRPTDAHRSHREPIEQVVRE